MGLLKAFLSPLPVLAVLAALILLPAGLVGGVWIWPTAWAFLAVFGGLSMLAYLLLAMLRPASFRVRQQGLVAEAEKQQPLIDALGLVLYVAFTSAWFILIPVDVFRLHLLAPPSEAVGLAGAVLVVAGVALTHVAIGQNRFAAPTIHDQSAEGQTVIDTGLYGIVRHPFYAAMLLVYLGTALWLGSYAAAIASFGFLILTLARTVIEEAWLRDHLPDYAAYAKRVRGRLIPYIL
jgi:protein-S-isoprenylcysteine O-methyltransferase Ste14